MHKPALFTNISNFPNLFETYSIRFFMLSSFVISPTIYVIFLVSKLHVSFNNSSVLPIITTSEPSLANKIGESGAFYTKDIGKLGIKAISSCADDFLRVMQTTFSDISENGRSLMLQIGFDENSSYTMESEVGSQGDLLQDEIELWVESHSYNGNYHLQGVSPLKMIFDDIKLPLTDEAGNKFSTSRFGMEMLKFFRSLNLQVSRSYRGSTLYITIK